MAIALTYLFQSRQYAGIVIVTAMRLVLRYPLAYEHGSVLLPNEDWRTRELHLTLSASLHSQVEQALSALSQNNE